MYNYEEDNYYMYIRSCYMTLYRYTFQSGNEDSDLSTTHLRDF